jgi:hypothetical protein
MTMSLTCALIQECRVCRRPRDDEQAAIDMIDAGLFGAAPMALCCGCHQKVDSDMMRDPNYRARWRRRARRLAKHEEIGTSQKETSR